MEPLATGIKIRHHFRKQKSFPWFEYEIFLMSSYVRHLALR